MKSTYEATIIFDADLPEEDRESYKDYYLETFSSCSHEPAHIDTWGIKRLAYPIDGHVRGDYALFTFTASKADIGRLNSMLTEDDTVLKFIIVDIGPDECEDEDEEDEITPDTDGNEVNSNESAAVSSNSNDLFDLIFGEA